MKRILLLSLSISFISFAQAQKKDKQVTAYAITGVQKGATSWTEVRLVDVATGEELQTIYSSANDAEILNARTGKPVVKKDVAANQDLTTTLTKEIPVNIVTRNRAYSITPNVGTNINTNINTNTNTNITTVVYARGVSLSKQSYDKPFATTSAACAYDKKFNRLYYTPMGINQLRYIDLKAKSPKVYYFEDEAFGVVKSKGDVASQITRMVIASDGNGYALSNDGNHLIRFTVKKKPEITDLGALTDDLTNGRYSVHSSASYGGDMIADKQGNLYLITSNRAVYKISVQSMQASYMGSIKGLPRGFSTNGAIATGDAKVIVSSSGNTMGYYSFDLNTLLAEQVSNGNPVFNASDLANASFAFEKKKKDEEEKPKEEITSDVARIAPTTTIQEQVVKNNIGVYPNPVTEGYFNLSFSDQKPGRYQIQFMDVAGKTISVQQANITSKVQVEEFRLPKQVAAGNYLVRVISEDGSYTNTNKLIVQ
jgi:hypothetical protein